MVGVIIGLALPGVGCSVCVLDTMFVDLIKTTITPVVFCTIVIGVGSARKAATVGKMGGPTFGVVGFGAEVVVGTLGPWDLEPALPGRRRSRRQVRGPATDDRPADCHVLSSGIPQERDPILEMRSAPT